MDVSANIWLALALTIFAGLSTGIGSAAAYFIKRPRIGYLSFSLGLSAGVMIYISFAEFLPNATKMIGELWAVVAFFVGMMCMWLIDMMVPESENPHHYQGLGEPAAAAENHRLMRTGIFIALAIGIHNFPEGLATFASALSNVKIGVFVAFAVAIHNIPEGIAVSVPIFYATGNKNKAFFYSFLSGLSEPVGAIIGYLVLMPFLNESVLAAILAFVAGIMIYLSLDELLPMAHRYGHEHLVISGVMAGMFIMAVSLLML